MGYQKNELESIKTRFLKSNPSDITSFLQYLEELISANETSPQQLSLKKLTKLNSDPSSISFEELQFMMEFALEQIPLSRTSDKASCLVGTLSKMDFYTRELKYSKIEKFIFNLKSI